MAKFTPKSNDTIKEQLDAQEKVSILIPSTPGTDPAEDYKVVVVNGYTFKIMAGEQVEVPQTVAEILMNSNKTIAQVNKKYADMTVGGGRNLSKPEPQAED